MIQRSHSLSLSWAIMFQIRILDFTDIVIQFYLKVSLHECQMVMWWSNHVNIEIAITVKPVLSGHPWDQEKEAL
jgi:hypothetical protein